MYNFSALNAQLLAHCRDFLPLWLPGGVLKGKEYVCASLQGGRGESLSINTVSGLWADFSTSQSGGDLIDLYAAIHSIDLATSYRQLTQEYPTATLTTLPDIPVPTWTAIKPPKAAIEPPIQGATHVGIYRDTQGDPLFYIARFDTPTGKEIRPFSWCKASDGDRSGWHRKSWVAPRPLYNLHLLALHPDRPVLIVEGERTADAAQELVGDNYVVTTWPNGAQAYERADWKPLHGKKTLIWPDCDQKLANETTGPKYGIQPGEKLPHRYQPGMAAGLAIAAMLAPNCPEVKIITFHASEASGEAAARPEWAPFDGWDAFDAVRDGFTWDSLVEWAQPRAMLCKEPEPSVDPVEIVYPESPPAQETALEPGEEPNVPIELNALFHSLGVHMSTRGNPVTNIDTLVKIFSLPAYANLAYYDEFHDMIFHTDTGRQWLERDDLSLAWRLQHELNLDSVDPRLAREAITFYAHGHTRNEPKSWLSELVWDGTPRLDFLFPSYFGAVISDYHCAVSRNFLISIVARIMNPGCKVDNMVILEGAQGTFKSTALAIIGGKFCMESSESVLSKDFYQTLRGKFLVIINELQSFSKAEVNTVKNMITRSSDTYRKSYGRDSQDFPRRCVFIGATNEDHYLHDVTGARRFWPVKAGKILIPQLRQDRDQLFAEAYKAYQDGATWHEVPLQEASEAQEARRSHDEWESHVEAFINNAVGGVTVSDILINGLSLPLNRITKSEQIRVTKILRILGWRDKVSRRGNNTVRIWVNGNS